MRSLQISLFKLVERYYSIMFSLYGQDPILILA